MAKQLHMANWQLTCRVCFTDVETAIRAVLWNNENSHCAALHTQRAASHAQRMRITLRRSPIADPDHLRRSETFVIGFAVIAPQVRHFTVADIVARLRLKPHEDAQAS
jgi:hypothetical protein